MTQKEIPLEWLNTQLGAIVPYGKTQKCVLSDVTDDTWVLELEDVEKESARILSRVSAKDRPFKSTKNRFKKGNVLYGKLRPYLNKVAVADSPGVCTTEIIPLDAEPFVLNRYLFYWLRTRQFLNYVTDVSYGVNMPRLGTKDGVVAPFVLAPLAEQKVIADKLDTLLAQVDNTKARLERIPKILKRFRQSVLAAAVSGRLTEEWRKNNHFTDVEQTLDEIDAIRALQVKGKTKKTQDHLKQEEFVIPEHWKWVSLDSLAKKIVDGTHHTPTYVDNGIPFISVKDIKGGKVSFKNTKFVTEQEHIELSKRCPIEKGDLLITKSGTIGRTALVNTNDAFSIFVSVALIKPMSSKVNIRYIDIALQKWVNEIDVSSRIVGSAIKNLHLRDMKVLAIPFAPEEEQTEIIRQVDQLLAHADRIEQQVNNALVRVNNLTQSILAKAFRGELTEQWREDNPDLINGEHSAEALLEKIKIERATMTLTKRTRKSKANV